MKLIDEKIVDNALKCLNKETKCPLIKEQEETVIEEGVKYFKVSPRLFKLALKIEKKAKRAGTTELDNLVKKIITIANDFELLEDKYYLSKDVKAKIELKAQYNTLMKKYEDIIRMLKKSEITTALKSIGGLAFTIALMTVPYIGMQHFFPDLIAVKDGNNSVFRYLKRAGAFVLCGIPVRAARSATFRFTDDMEAKVLARTGKLLKDTDVDFKDYSDEEYYDKNIENIGKYKQYSVAQKTGINFSELKLYHVSEVELNDLKPRVPNNFLTKNDFEDNTTKRVCFCPSIDQCLMAMSSNLKNKILHVYSIKTKDYISPKIDDVPDVKLTDEKWVLRTVKKSELNYEFDIKIIGAKSDTPYEYTYGNNKKANLYKWNYKVLTI